MDKYTKKIETPTLLLMNRCFDIIGKINRFENWNISLVGNGIDEISFDVHKFSDGKLCPVWNDLIDLKIVDVSGFGKFEISVDYTDNTETVKSVHGVSLEAELAQIGLYDFHVNDEEAADMVVTDYSKDNYDSEGKFIPTTFYRKILDTDTPEEAEFKRKHSLLHRVLADKAPHWSIGYVTPCIALDEESEPEESEKFQRTYTVDGDSIYDFLTGTVAEESNVIFTFDVVKNQATGKLERTINCYSLCDCIDQKSGEVFCKGIGEDTFVLISKNKLANEITISSNKDNVKNCFRIEGGDDIITDMVRAVNMNGSNYIYQFADFQYNDMPEELFKAITEYNNDLSKEENTYYGNGDIDKFLNGSLTLCVNSELEAVTALCICKNNRIKTSSLDISRLSYPQYWSIVASENSKELYISKIEKTPNATVTNAFNTMGIYSRLCIKYDELAYFESSMMPDVTISKTTAEEQYNIMKNALKDNSMVVGVSSLNNYDSNLFVGVSNNVEAMANILIDARYKAEIINDTTSYNDDDKDNIYWTGNIRITRAADETDYYPKTDEQLKTCFNVKISADELTFTRQKIEKALHKGSMLDIDFDVADMDDTEIREYFYKYSLNRLKSFYDGYNSCLSILMQMDADSPVRKELYEKYYNRMRIISNPPAMDNPDEIPGVLDIRQQQVNNIYSEIGNIKTEQIKFQEKWDFKKYLEDKGKDFYKIFCSYRREDVYSNNNYVSDGLTSSECLAKAKELIEAATKEAKKACVLQRTVSTTLNNLFALPEFEPFYETFALYNYIRIRTEDEILKLRLIGIDFSGDSAEKIEVTFSEQIESIDGTLSDLQSVIQQAKSMATSYPSTALQAKQGAEANGEIADIYDNGLNAEKTMFANNNSNEVTITSSGIICKRMDDEGFYGDKQLRITGNIMAFTDDGWKSVRMAIGETSFDDPTEDDPTEETKKQAYGIIADNIVGKLIVGDKMFIGNKQNNVIITGDGIDITNGSIALSNGEYSIELDPNHRLNKILNNIRSNFLFCIRNKNIPIDEENNDIIMGIDTDGNGYFKGRIKAGSGRIANFNISENELYTDGAAFDNNTGIYFGSKGLKIGDKFKIDKNGNLTSSGVLNLANGNITYNSENNLTVKGNIQANNGTFSGEISSTATITGGKIKGTEIRGGSIIGTDIEASVLSVYKTIYMQYAEGHTRIPVFVLGSASTPATLTLGNGDGISDFKVYPDTEFYKDVYVDGLLQVGNINIDGNVQLQKIDETTGKPDIQRITAEYKDGKRYGVLSVDKDLLSTSIGWSGSSSYGTILNLRGKTVKAPNNGGVTVTSDERLKNSFKLLDEFDSVYMDLKPCAFKYNNGTSGRYHFGVTAQNVKESLEKNGYTTKDFAGFVQMSDNSESEDYCGIDDPMGIIYTEFTMWNTHMIQKLYKKIKEQQKEINFLKNSINDLLNKSNTK